MSHPEDVSQPDAPDVDLEKRQWLQGRREQPADADEQATAESPAEIMADFIRQYSANGQLVARELFLQPPYSVEEAELAPCLETIKEGLAGEDIAWVQGSQDEYYYSTQTMTANYADMCVQVVEKDICRAIAQAVRFDCQTYPRPYKVAMLEQSPYGFAPQQIEAALAAIETHPDYADIRPVASSNGVPYLFSERFMSYGKAYGLCEWLEVEQFQNP
ncbi:TPA: YdhW family putative oxidoreductase system protein [Citrobacter freundii]|uniref:YdhW family putative oxidoreductase system protein n=1 Tax=Citrobacter farmeri TaxID=67824 RepID=UPI000F68239F|nr:YdhW family putative oxidoreductase system protein [Citrobacter farmeri]HAT2287046.1 YdhW family putative oxidoreductase system protein [Citrobacter freundii]EKV7296448.1 YdhW family putative oxidoreductase system protein [Citrobacter farmeri]ELR9636838.1 YdhW family putative oxidoreductase system protein [Citrobacter farmeri]MBJ8746365.1 YdhW family putative oxidoreductase system protein [Citrobacter farmeri]MBJ8759872.1 YdhW family putative oxidoreductase system protein [Citrobacter farme